MDIVKDSRFMVTFENAVYHGGGVGSEVFISFIDSLLYSFILCDIVFYIVCSIYCFAVGFEVLYI